MTTKQFKTHGRIIDYIDAVDPELAQIIRALTVDIALSSLKGKLGITFLMPQDKAFRAKLEKLAYSDKVEDAHKAQDMLNALIIKDVFKTPSDWMSKRNNIPNSLYPSQHVEVAGATAKEVKFASGAVAVLDPDFNDASKRNNLAVWKLVSGEIPVTTDKPAKNNFVKHGKNEAKIGGYVPTGQHTQQLRYKIAIVVENTYILCRSQGMDRQHCPYLETTLSLVHYIGVVANNTALLTDTILPMLSYDKLDFYLIVEPHRDVAGYIVDDATIDAWWKWRANNHINPFDVMRFIEKLLNSSTGALIYSDREKIIEEIVKIRAGLSEIINSRARSSVDEIQKVYAALDSNNAIGQLQPIYPNGLATIYKNKPGLKMLHDELRYITYGAFKQLERCEFDAGAYNELLNMIGEYLYVSNDASANARLLNRNSIKTLISPSEKVNEIKIFVFSTMFLYIPMTSLEAENLKYKHKTTRPDPNNIMIYNIAKDIYMRHQRLLAASNDSVATMLKSLDVNTLDPALRAELQKKFT